MKLEKRITNPTVFRAIMAFFPEVAQRVKDKFKKYSYDAYIEVLTPFFSKVSANKISNSKYSYKDLYDHFSSCFRVNFTI